MDMNGSGVEGCVRCVDWDYYCCYCYCYSCCSCYCYYCEAPKPVTVEARALWRGARDWLISRISFLRDSRLALTLGVMMAVPVGDCCCCSCSWAGCWWKLGNVCITDCCDCCC